MVDIKHPSYELNRGIPSRASVGTETYDLDDDGYLTVEGEAEAVAVMQRLAQTYSVEYDDEGEITDTNAPVSTDDDGGEEDSGDSSDTDEGDTDAQTPDEDAEDGTAESMDRADLEEQDMDDLRERFDELGGDPEPVDMRQKDEVVAAILRLQADSVQDESDESA